MTEKETQIYNAALDFTRRKHAGQFRKGGDPYVTHPIAVAETLREWGYGLEWQLAGLFHDLLEDTDATEEELKALGGERVLETVKKVTKAKDYDMNEYVREIKADPMAAAVKAADRLHNLRCAVVTDDEFKRRYVWETIDFYLDLPHGDEIAKAAVALRKTMNRHITELPMTYKPSPRGLFVSEG